MAVIGLQNRSILTYDELPEVLINALVGYKIAITSDKAGTTRNVIQGIYNDDECQIVFVDTPGIHKPKYKLVDIENEAEIEMTDDEKIDFIAARILKLYRPAFEELAK